MNNAKKIAKVIGIVMLVLIGLPAIKLAAACLAGLVVGIFAAVITAPLYAIPALLLLALFVWIDYKFVKWLVGKFC